MINTKEPEMDTKFEHDELDTGGLDAQRRARLTRSVLLKSDTRYVHSTSIETLPSLGSSRLVCPGSLLADRPAEFYLFSHYYSYALFSIARTSGMPRSWA